MFKKILTAVAVIAVVALIAVLFSSTFGEQFDEAKAGQQYSIRWDEVNVRSKPGSVTWKDTVITSIERGTDVTLTGYTYEFGDGPNPNWTQVQLEDGTVGWIVTESVNWHGELWWYY